MPTGYTAAVQDGKITEFRDFAMQCARAFGALITMRDDPSDAEIPARFEASTNHYDQSIREAERDLAGLEAMTPEQCKDKARAAYEQAVTDWQERRERRNAVRERYEAMLLQVEAWEPPSPDHVELRDFMRKQLTESIDFDCSDKYDSHPTFQPADEWRADQIGALRRSIERAKKHRQEEIERTERRNRWLSQLRESLRNV